MTDGPQVAGDANQTDILECIARAEERAAGDDRAFVRYLNECYAATSARMRTRGLPMAFGTNAVDRTPKSQQLLQDARYLQNARELARRMQGGIRVIGGMPVAKGEFLDCVAVGSDTTWGCTGTFIAPDVVVTAGHCIDFATRVFFGNDVTKGGRVVSIEAKHRHPQYQPGVERNDLMVLQLAERIENIAARKVADAGIVDQATDGRVVGFGNTDPQGLEGYGIKRQVDIAVASPACEGVLDGQTDVARYRCHAGFEIVAGKPLLAKDSCTGDSGGPFYVQAVDGWRLAGATSRATNAAAHDCGDGGIYVRVEHFLDWIRQLPGITAP